MNKRIKQRWLRALYNDEYQQGAGALRFGQNFCCLGVLCDLHSEETFVGWEYEERTGFYRYLGETVMLPRAVCEWAGITDQNPQVLQDALSTHNDAKRLSFVEIGKLIRRHL